MPARRCCRCPALSPRIRPKATGLAPCPQPPRAAMADQQPARMTPDEKRLARSLHFEQHETPTEIAGLLKRSLSAVCRLLAQRRRRAPLGGRGR